jgi:hypothetical protein
MRSLGPIVIAALAIAGQAAAQGADCRRIPVFAAQCFGTQKPNRRCPVIPSTQQPCFAVHGTIGVSNGTPGIRMWPRGTKRILGVFGGEGDAASPTVLPPKLRAAMDPKAPTRNGALLSVSGDFRICPLATERAGWMRPVCIVSARHVVRCRAST